MASLVTSTVTGTLDVSSDLTAGASNGFSYASSTRLLTITNSGNAGGINLATANVRIYFGGTRAIEGTPGNASGNLTFGEGYSSGKVRLIAGTTEVTGIFKYTKSVASNGVGNLKIIPSANDSGGVGYATQIIGVNIADALSNNFPKQDSVWGGVTGSSAIAINADDNSYGQFMVLTAPQNSSANTELTPRFWITGAGAATFSGTLKATTILDAGNSSGTSNQVLTSTGSATLDWKTLSEISGVDGSGTANYLSKWTDSDTIGNSIIYASAASVGISSVAFTSPAGTLHTQAVGINITYLDTYSTTNGTGSMLNFRKSDTVTAGTKTQTDSGDSLGTIGFYGVHSESDWGLGAGINVSQEGVSGTAYVPAHMAFATCTASAYVEQMRITSAGLVGIGTNAPSGAKLDIVAGDNSTPQIKLRAIGANTQAVIHASGSSGNFELLTGDGNSSQTIKLSIARTTGAATFSGSVTVEGDDTDVENLYVNQEAIFDGHAYPYADSSYTLGTSALRWSTIYGDYGNFNEQVRSNGLRIGGGQQNYAIRTFDVDFPNGVANQKADLTWGSNLSFWGWLEISLTATYSNQNSPGVVTKRFYLGMNPSNAIYTNEARYSDVGGATPGNFAISNATWDSTNSRYRIQIVHRVSTGNTVRGVIKVFGGSSSQVDNMMNNFSIGSVYTTDTTTFALPVIQLQAGGAHAWVDSSLGIGTSTPSELLDIETGGGGGHIELNNPDSGGNSFVIGITDTAAPSYGAAGSLFIRDGANSRFVLTPSGSIGIGTTSPGSNLDVIADATSAGLRVRHSNLSQGIYVGYSVITGAGSNANQDITINAKGTGDLLLNSTDGGNVGIGTTVPGEKLTVWNSNISFGMRYNSVTSYIGKGTGANGQTFGSTSNWIAFASDAADDWITFGTHKSGHSGGERVRIDPRGNVGIGTTAPAAKLEVRGGSATIPSLGSYGTLLKLVRADGLIGLSGDIDSATNNFWLQAQNSASPIAEAILLNPKGGDIGIGTNAPTNNGANSTTLDIRSTSYSFLTFGNSTNAVQAEMQIDTNGVSIAEKVGGFMRFFTSNAERMRILADGKVGIGTIAPSAPVHIRGDGGASYSLSTLFIESTTNHGGIGIDVENTKQAHVRFMSNGVLKWQMRSPFHDGTNPDSLRFYSWTHAADVMTLKNDGKVGIGTTNPTARLYVVETANNAWALQVKGTGTSANYGLDINCSAGYALSSQPFKVETPSGGPFFIDGNSNVGIGDGSPTYKLDVNGTGRFTGALTGTSATFSGLVTIDQNANATSLRIDSEATTDQVIEIDAPLTTTASVLDINDCNSLISGKIAYFRSNSSSANGRNLVEIVNDHVSATGTVPLKAIQDAANWTAIILNTSAYGYGLSIDTSADTGSAVYNLACYTGTNVGMFVTNQGRVGIGTTAPATTLDVRNGSIRLTDNYVIEWGGTKARINGSNAGDFLKFYTDDTPRIYVISDGNVGIGSATPALLFDVNSSRTHNFIGRFVNTSTVGWGAYIEGGGDSDDYSLLIRNQASSDLFAIMGDGEIRVANQTLVDSSNSEYTMTFPDEAGIAMGSAYTYANIYGKTGNLYLRANSYPANTGSNGIIYLQTSNSSGGQAADVVVNNGKVGIGATAPTATLQVGTIDDTTESAASLVHLLSSTASSTVNGFSTLKLDYKAGGAPGTAGAQIMFTQGYHSGNPDYTQPVGAIRGWKTGPNYNYGGGLQFLYQPNLGSIGVVVGMTLTGGGSVGIGTPTPVADLDICGADASKSPNIKLTGTAGDVSTTRLHIMAYDTDNSSINFDAYLNDAQTAWVSSDAGSNAQLKKTGDKFYINYDSGVGVNSQITWNNGLTMDLTNGNVGIGTTAPAAPLHVHKDSSTAVRLVRGATDGPVLQFYRGASNAGNVSVRSSGLAFGGGTSEDDIFIDTAGKVGINDITPSYQLDVNGTFRVTGAATFSSSVTASSFSGNGASISALNALNISAGTVGTARLGSGTANSSTFLAGNNTWATPSNTTYSAGTGLTLSSTTFSTKLDELTDMTADVVGSQDELILLDNGSDRRKQINEIKLGQFNNDQGWTSNAGTVTSVTAGTGMTQSGTSSINPTLNVIGGLGITANANDIALNLNELVDSNKIAAGDKVAFVDLNASSQSAICEVSDIPLSVFDNDSGWINGSSLNASNLSAGTVPAARLGNVTIASSAADVLSASNGAISADDANTDKLVFWDDSAGKLKYLTFSDLTALP